MPMNRIFFKDSQEALRKELDPIQNRLSKLIDMHLDGAIDSETYHLKLEEYKKRQREITSEIAAIVCPAMYFRITSRLNSRSYCFLISSF